MTLEQAHQQLIHVLLSIYDKSEAANIANIATEHITGFVNTDRILHKNNTLTIEQENKFRKITNELATEKPIQYILNEAWFYNMKFFVNEKVLIPRPETEELIELVKINNAETPSIIDIGTGSGCIAISLKSKFPHATITALDKSNEALQVAQLNAKNLNTTINFIQNDFLDESTWSCFQKFDVIVSNPPYVKQSEDVLMKKNVLDFEPHLALFVPDNDSLIFYKKIALFSKNHLKENGKIYLEINESLGQVTKQLFQQFGYHVSIIKDLQEKERFIVCNNP